MNRYHSYADLELLTLLGQHDEQAFSTLYDRYADKLYRFVYGKVKEKETTEEIVQEIFIALWSKRDTLLVTFSLDAYLYGAARNKILSYIRSENVRRKYAADFVWFAVGKIDNSSEELINLKDLQAAVDKNIRALPLKCQEAFRLSRIENLPIAEVAAHMHISTRTVENYLTQALRHLRKTLTVLAGLLFGLWP